MDVEKLIHCLQCCSKVDAHNIGCDDCGLEYCGPECQQLCGTAATALSTLQEENAQLRAYLEYEREHADAYYEECGQWEAENEKLRAELESVRAERNAAVEDVAAIIGDVEEIRRGYGVDNEDADSAFARLCETYCANNGRSCYAECEKYHCKNFKWRGQKKD